MKLKYFLGLRTEPKSVRYQQNPPFSKLHIELLKQFESSRAFTNFIKTLLPKKRTEQPWVGSIATKHGTEYLRLLHKTLDKDLGNSLEVKLNAISRSTFPRQHRPKDLSSLQCDVHLIENKYCEETRPQNQLSAAQEQYNASAPFSPHHLFGSGWHHLQQSHWNFSRSWILTLKELRNLFPSIIYILSTTLPNLSTYQTHTFQYYYQLPSGAGFRSSLQPS